MTNRDIKEKIKVAIDAAFQAGLEILKVYKSDFAVEQKEDKSPLTEADRRGHEKIMSLLANTGIPILSEEGREIPYIERKEWKYLWIVDPLDGTKEFVKRNGEFTVNIALVKEGKPIAGVIYVPVKDTLYFGIIGIGAFKQEQFCDYKGAKLEDIILSAHKLPLKVERPYTIVGSRSHMSIETEDYVETRKKEYGEVEILSVGSSLKLCMVAEGKADEYPRFAPTMEWDTAAGQAIAEASGAKVLNWETKKSMTYNRENLLNDWFLVTK